MVNFKAIKYIVLSLCTPLMFTACEMSEFTVLGEGSSFSLSKEPVVKEPIVKEIFEGDLARDITQSTPSKLNIPLGIEENLDVEFLGAFRPIAGGEGDSNFATGTLAYNSDNGSIFLAGLATKNVIAEFEVPVLSKAEKVADLPQARVLQSYVKVLEDRDYGKKTNRITGLLYREGRLHVNSEIWYDGNADNVDNHQVFADASSLATSDYKGLLQLQGEAEAAGYMSHIPEDWQDVLGAEYLTGWASNYSITSRYSQGPSMFLFDPQEAADVNPAVDRSIYTEALLVYPFGGSKVLVPGGDKYRMDISPLWGPTARAMYGFIIPNTDIFMVLGKHGGIHSGIGYKITQDTGHVCAGGCTYEAKDNYNFFWLYDMKDIVGAESTHSPRPFSFGKWSHPYDKGFAHKVIGAAYDHETERLFVSLNGAARIREYDRPPLIVVYKISRK